MNRGEFLQRLAGALRKMPAEERAEILADYERYFADGAAAGRTDEQVAESLGRPARLAAELLLAREAGPEAAPGARHPTLRPLWALLVLVVDGVAWLPLMLAVLLILLLIGAGIVALVYGCFHLLVGPFDLPLGGIGAALLRGIGWLSAGIAALATARAGVHLVARLFTRMRNRRVSRLSTEVST